MVKQRSSHVESGGRSVLSFEQLPVFLSVEVLSSFPSPLVSLLSPFEIL